MSLPIVLYQYIEETEFVNEYSKVQCAINLMVDETHSYFGAQGLREINKNGRLKNPTKTDPKVSSGEGLGSRVRHFRQDKQCEKSIQE